MKKLIHRFVEFIPEVLDNGILYVSIAHGTVVHRCCCGCKREVVTPLTPADWKLIFDGETVSLQPSIGNWNFPYRSHYWITKNRIEWAPRAESKGIRLPGCGKQKGWSKLKKQSRRLSQMLFHVLACGGASNNSGEGGDRIEPCSSIGAQQSASRKRMI